MHYHAEIILPPTPETELESTLETILQPFSKHDEDNRHTFWDWYVIGGRWAGEKLMKTLPADELKAFHAWLHDQKTTVSGFRAGKSTLEPSGQRIAVDAKWNAMFADRVGEMPCPIFDHCGKTIKMDVCRLEQVPQGLSCARVIFAGPTLQGEAWNGPPAAVFMLTTEEWNGVTLVKTVWDGTITTARQMLLDYFENYADEYREAITPQDDWLAVTVDYHS